MQNLPKIFVKVSGDQYLDTNFLQWLQSICRRPDWIVVCVGGGTPINETFRRHGIPHDKPHGPLGRELETFYEKQLARDVLENIQVELEDQLIMMNAIAKVIIPVLDLGGVLSHVNGDQMVRTAYVSYDKLYVVTTEERLEKKRSEFADLPKVTVIAF